MKKIKFLLILLPIFLLTGCYNYHELNQLAITSAIGIDKTEDGYRATIQVMNTQKSGSDTNSAIDQPKFITYSYEDKTMQEAFRKIIMDSSKRIYANHIQVLVIGSELAEEGIFDILDMFFRNSESRKQFVVVIAKDCEAEEVLNIITPLETLNSKNIRDGLTVDSRYLGIGEVITYEDMIGTYLDSNKEITLPTVEIKGSEEEGEQIDNIEGSDPDARLIAGPMAVFKDDKMLGYLSEEESISLGFVRDRISNTVLSYECGDDKYAVAEIIDTKTEVGFEINPLKAKINIVGNLNINEITCDLDLENPKVIDEIEKNLEDELKTQVSNSINSIIEEYNTDVFGFRDNLYKSYPKYYKDIKDGWYDEVFSDLDIEVEVKFEFIQKGNALKVIER